MNRRSLDCAAVAALSLGAFIYEELRFDAAYSAAKTFPEAGDVLLLAAVPLSYLAAALLLEVFDKRGSLPFPVWMTISCLGSVIFTPLFMQLFPTPSVDGTTIVNPAAAFVLVTAPFTALVYYSPAIVRLLKRCRRGLRDASGPIRK